MELTFASYNIHKAVGVDGRFDPDRIIRVLRELHADVIALQECDRRFGERESVLPKALLDDTPWRAAEVSRRPRSLGWHGNALLVRRDIEIVETEARAPADARAARRGARRPQIEAAHRLRVLGMHLDLSACAGATRSSAVLRHCDDCDGDCPTVLLGDFNQWGAGRRALRELREGWQVLETGRSFPSRQPLASLDRIVASPEWSCRDARVHHSASATSASDHLPVVARLALALSAT